MKHTFTFFAIMMMAAAFSTGAFAINGKIDCISNIPDAPTDPNSSYSNVWRIWSKCMGASPSTFFDVDLSYTSNTQVVYIGPIVHYPEIYRLTLTGTYTVATNTLVIDIRNDVNLGDGWTHCRTDRHTTQLTNNTINDVIGVLTFNGSAGCTTAIDLEHLLLSDAVTSTCPYPDAISAEGISRNEILVHINGNDSINYRLYYTDGLSMDSVLINDTVYTITGLQMGTMYSISVASICGDGTRSAPIGTTASTLSCPNNCNVTISMVDSYGDGWNGNTINGYSNEVLLFSSTIGSGYYGSFSKSICADDTIVLKWQMGSWPEETSFDIYVGNELRVSGSGQSYSTGDIIVVINGCPTDSLGDTNVSASGGFDENGASLSIFSVSDIHRVRFSRGNLQYNAMQGNHATNDGGTAQGTWRFAERQYDYVGNGNANASSNYYGWIDLFGWGTSGWNSGATSYQPWSTDNSTNSNYWPGGNANNNLTGEYANADWAVYNAISNGGNQPNMWRTLTSDEFVYLLETRNASTLNGTNNARYVKATVNGIGGVILFPDVYEHPIDVAVPSGINTSSTSTTVNVYSTSQWGQMESAGCVFLPMAGDRYGTWYRNGGIYGCYWTSSQYNSNHAFVLNFWNSDNESYINSSYHFNRYDSYSIRPVMDYNNTQDTLTMTDTITQNDTVFILVHDTTILMDTVTLTEYVPVHDTTYIDVHDTTYINVPVHDTTIVTDTVTLTEYVPVHDTTVVTDTVTLTEYVLVHDTTYIDLHDTTYINVFVHDTTVVTDTVTLTQFDTITNTVYDTIDNIVYDTVVLTDTIWLHDTIFIHDTIYITDEGIDGVDALNAKVYSSQGQIVVEGADGNAVTLFDVNGRMLATKQDYGTEIRFDVPASGTYILKIGNHPARKVVVIR